MRFKFEFGPAFIAVVIQTIGAIVAATMCYAALNNTANNTKATADRLETIVDRVQHNQGTTGERLVKVETTLGALTDTVARMDTKLDALRTR